MVVQMKENGQIDTHIHGEIPQDVIWLPRLGMDLCLPAEQSEFAYYGHGPMESYCDMCHHAPVSMYHSNADREYVPYVHPQEHGNHNGVKWFKIGNMQFLPQKEMEIHVSNYSAKAILQARHTDELKKDGFIHVRLDYKVSGIGSNSCGPELLPKYRLQEKTIDFAFTMLPDLT